MQGLSGLSDDSAASSQRTNKVRLVLFCDRRKPEHFPVTTSQYVPDQVILVQTLHNNDDDATLSLVIQPGGGMIKVDWFQKYTPATRPPRFDFVFQSWDTANKITELSDFSVCTTWGVKDKHLYLLGVRRSRMGYPELKRAVHEQYMAFHPTHILIEDKASGTQLIQELINERVYAVTGYEPKMDKVMRLHSVTSLIENGMVHLPENADWLNEYLHELTTFPRGKHDDQADSTSQALDWIKQRDLAPHISVYTLLI
jgi:predicted phage terminase large subunit-like protein